MVESARLDGCLLASPFGIQQFPVVFAIVNCFQDGFDRKIVLFGDLLGTERLSAEGFAIQDFGANAPAHGELLIARTALRFQVLVSDRFRHDLALQAWVSYPHRNDIVSKLQLMIASRKSWLDCGNARGDSRAAASPWPRPWSPSGCFPAAKPASNRTATPTSKPLLQKPAIKWM